MKDRAFLLWIHARLIERHNENPNVDYMNKLKCIAESTDPAKETSNLYSSAVEIPAGYFEPPHTKDIDRCANLGCAFNGRSGYCSSDFGQCYGYIPPLPNVV
jgi:hypothetical protein